MLATTDQNKDYKAHFNYTFFKDGEDRKRDLNGELQKLVESANNKFFRAVKKCKYSKGVGKNFKLDYTKKGKLDVTFIKLDTQLSDLDSDFNQRSADVLTQKRMNDPKKIF